MSFSFLPKIKHYYGISVKLFIYQGKTILRQAGLAFTCIPTGQHRGSLTDGEWTRGRDSNSHNRSCSTTHNLSVTTRFFAPSVQPVAPEYIDLPKSREIWTNGD